MGLIRWYWQMTKAQRVLCWIVSFPCCLIYGIGLAMIVLLLYSHLGKEKYLAELVVKATIVHTVLSENE